MMPPDRVIAVVGIVLLMAQLRIAHIGRASGLDADMCRSCAPVQGQVFECFVTFPAGEVTFGDEGRNFVEERVNGFQRPTVFGGNVFTHVAAPAVRCLRCLL